MTTTTLTERYLAAATEGVPDSQRDEFRRELTERIGDDIDARVAGGASPSDAEYLALSELGDPDVLVAIYLDRRQYLIGPRLFPTWKRLLRILALTVVPTVAVAFPLAQALAHKSFGEIVGSTVVTLLMLAVHLGFWTTLVFAVLERSLRGAPITEWKPEALPALANPARQELRADFIASLALIAVFAFGILFHPVFLPFRDAEGEAIPLFRPDTWAWMQWYLFGVLAIELVFWTVLHVHGRWNYWLATTRLLPSVAFAIPVAWAFANDQLFNHEFLERTNWNNWAELIAPGGVVAIVFAFLIASVAVVVPIDGFIKARRAGRGRRAVEA